MIHQNIKHILILSLACTLFPISFICSQDVNIVPYLKRIENGDIEKVKDELVNLKEENPGSPSLLFLEGVLTENGSEAVIIYQKIVDDYPQSKYADAALYRIYSYYYALGLYESADKKLNQLKTRYPESPYVKIASQNQLPVSPEIANEDNPKNPPEETPKSEDLEDQKYKYTIQAGAFSNIENAESLRSDFIKSGIYSEVKDKSVAGTVFHVVYAGKFKTEDEAESFLNTINEKFNLTGRIVEIQH